jgi:hypothetical protein
MNVNASNNHNAGLYSPGDQKIDSNSQESLPLSAQGVATSSGQENSVGQEGAQRTGMDHSTRPSTERSTSPSPSEIHATKDIFANYEYHRKKDLRLPYAAPPDNVGASHETWVAEERQGGDCQGSGTLHLLYNRIDERPRKIPWYKRMWKWRLRRR